MPSFGSSLFDVVRQVVMRNPILVKAFEKHVRDFLCSESYCFIKEVSLRMRREHLTHRSLNINKHVSIHPSTCRCKIVSRTNIEAFHPLGTSDTNQKVVGQMNSIGEGNHKQGVHTTRHRFKYALIPAYTFVSLATTAPIICFVLIFLLVLRKEIVPAEDGHYTTFVRRPRDNLLSWTEAHHFEV